MSSFEDGSAIIIRGLPLDISAEVLYEYLETKVNGINKDEQDKPKIAIILKAEIVEKADAIVSFVSIEMANNAVTQLNGYKYQQNNEYTLTAEVQEEVTKFEDVGPSKVNSTEEEDDNWSIRTAIPPDASIEDPVEEPTPPESTFICIVCTEVWPEKDIISCVAVSDTQSKESHYICIDCSCKHARSLTIDGPVGIGGAGLPCCNQGCENVIIWEPLKNYLDSATIRLVDKRMDSAAMLCISDLERCIKCDFGMCIESKNTVIQYFDCQNEDCKALFCRDCKVDFDAHINKSCADAAPVNPIRIKFEEEMSAVVIRNCPKCQSAFQKLDGCNFMTCSVCNTNICYLCRQAIIDESHFDNEVCIQGASSSVLDELRLEEIKKKARKDGVDDLDFY